MGPTPLLFVGRQIGSSVMSSIPRATRQSIHIYIYMSTCRYIHIYLHLCVHAHVCLFGCEYVYLQTVSYAYEHVLRSLRRNQAVQGAICGVGYRKSQFCWYRTRSSTHGLRFIWYCILHNSNCFVCLTGSARRTSSTWRHIQMQLKKRSCCSSTTQPLVWLSVGWVYLKRAAPW